MQANDKNVRVSFRKVKSDIRDLRKKISELVQNQEQFVEMVVKNQKSLDELKLGLIKLKNKKTTKKTSKKTIRYVASETGSKFHIESCPYAKNIKRKSKVYFKSKKTPLAQGYKACSCVK